MRSFTTRRAEERGVSRRGCVGLRIVVRSSDAPRRHSREHTHSHCLAPPLGNPLRTRATLPWRSRGRCSPSTAAHRTDRLARAPADSPRPTRIRRSAAAPPRQPPRRSSICRGCARRSPAMTDPRPQPSIKPDCERESRSDSIKRPMSHERLVERQSRIIASARGNDRTHSRTHARTHARTRARTQLARTRTHSTRTQLDAHRGGICGRTSRIGMQSSRSVRVTERTPLTRPRAARPRPTTPQPAPSCARAEAGCVRAHVRVRGAVVSTKKETVVGERAKTIEAV